MRTVIIVSYWSAPNPAVGAKRFSFLAREFTRLGYDVHVISHESRDWTDWKTDSTLPLAGARIARRLGWPLILDYLDPWSAHHWPRWRRGAVSAWFARRIEARLVRQSAARVLNTPAMRDSFE